MARTCLTLGGDAQERLGEVSGSAERSEARLRTRARHLLLGSTAAALVVLVGGCGSQASELLGDVHIVPSSAESLDRVDLGGVSENLALEEADLWLIHDGAEIPLPILLDDAGPYFVAPLHPDSPLDGGSVELVFEFDGERSVSLELDVRPLPPVPGAWNDAVAHFRDAIAFRAEQNGMTFEQLQDADIADLPPALAPLKLAQVYVDDGSDTDLESLLTSPTSGLTADDVALIDALVAKLDLRVLVGDIPRVSMFRGVAPVAHFDATAPRPVALGGGLACRDAGIQVNDAAELSEKMVAAFDNQILEGGAEQRVLNGIGSVTAVGGFIPTVGAPISAVGTFFTAAEAYKNGIAGLYPSLLQSLTAKISGDTFTEDFVIGHAWFDVEVRATSRGWAADADVAKTVLSVASTTGSFVAGSKVVGASNAEGFVVDSMMYARDAAATALVEEHSNLLRFCPEDWTVDITDEPWSTGRALLDLFTVDSAARSFEPKETGLELPVDDTLRVEANPAAFPRQSVFMDFPITVLPIMVGGPGELFVSDLGGTIDVTVTIRNAFDFESLDWQTTKGAFTGNATLSGESGPFGGAIWTRAHATPSIQSDYPYVITVESTSSSGLRADGQPPRLHQITVRAAQIIVEPNPVTMGVEATQQFTARDRNGNAVPVVWTATGGSITRDGGLYTAGRAPGTYEVTATSAQDPNLVGKATVTIVEIECPIGEWEILNLADFIGQIFTEAGGAAPGVDLVFGGGRYFLTFREDGTYLGHRVGLTVVAATDQGTLITTLDVVDTGRWSHDKDTGTFTIVEGPSSGTGTVTIESAEGTFSFESDVEDGGGVSGSGTYECTGPTLILSFGAFQVIAGPGSPP